MYFLLLFLFLVAGIITIVFLEPVAISFFLDTNRMDMHAVVKWIPFMRLEARVIDFRVFITVYFFRGKIYSRFMKPRKKGKSSRTLFESMALSGTSAKIAYGFNEPHLTGIFCGAAAFVGSLIRSADIELEPEFIPDNEFLRIKAKTNLNIGKSFINMLRIKYKNNRRRKNYGTAEFNN